MFSSDELWVLFYGQTQVLGSDLDLEAAFSSVSKVSGYQTSVMSIEDLSDSPPEYTKEDNTREAHSQRN